MRARDGEAAVGTLAEQRREQVAPERDLLFQLGDALARGRDRYFRLLQLDVRVDSRAYALADEIENRLALCQRGLGEIELLEAAPELRVGARDAGREFRLRVRPV